MIITPVQSKDQLPAATLIPLVQNDALPDALQKLSSVFQLPDGLLQQDFKAEPGETFSFYHDTRRIFLLGLGARPGFGDILKSCRSFSFKFRQKLPPRLGVGLNLAPANHPFSSWVEAVVNGLLLGSYQIGRFKTQNSNEHPFHRQEAEVLLWVDKDKAPAAREAALRGQTVAETQMRIFDLVNAPSNKKLPADLSAWALASGKQYGYQVRVLDKAQIEATGLHALLAVNRGSEHPPTFTIMEYRPHEAGDQPLPRVGLVGKGVTFDTGGLSIKPAGNMHFMKSDMGGAGAVFGTMELAARLQLPVHLFGIVPATENSVDARSIKPSDVIDSYSGKTIEIIDTDAEGRLILADGLAYMVRQFNPEVLVDLATLTGSAVRTFGYHAAALFSNNDDLADQLYRVGERTGERVWRLPVWEVYQDDIKSDVADVRNFSGRPLAGAIGAAKFLEAFIGDHTGWAHLDIAGVAFTDSEFSTQKSATAFGIRLLLEYLCALKQ